MDNQIICDNQNKKNYTSEDCTMYKSYHKIHHKRNTIYHHIKKSLIINQVDESQIKIKSGKYRNENLPRSNDTVRIRCVTSKLTVKIRIAILIDLGRKENISIYIIKDVDVMSLVFLGSEEMISSLSFYVISYPGKTKGNEYVSIRRI